MHAELTDIATAPSIDRDANQMGGFAKGLAVIEAFGHGRNALTIAEVARLSGLDRATARRCLLTLVSSGYALANGRYFELSPRILRLGHAYLSSSLPRLLRPSLEELADRLRESCSASVLDGTEVVYIARATQHHLIAAGLHAGSRLPAYCTSMGRVLLASLPSEQAMALLQASNRKPITERTLTDLDDLMAELERVRAQGYAIVDQELEIGSRSIAVPIRNMSGRTVAAFNAGLRASQASCERLKNEVLPHLLATQFKLEEFLP